LGGLKEEIRELALGAGFNSVGFTTPELVDGLRYGWVFDVRELKRPREFMPEARSVIMLTLHVWDPTFMMQINSPEWKGYMFHGPDEEIEGYYIAYQVSMAKAMPIVSRLMELGYKAEFNTAIPMKTTAVACGLGRQGKNTLLVTSEVGPRVGLMSILTSAELEPDKPFGGGFLRGLRQVHQGLPHRGADAIQDRPHEVPDLCFGEPGEDRLRAGDQGEGA
jgi:epoxyqueuosine reductase